jgi:hypothetical protein
MSRKAHMFPLITDVSHKKINSEMGTFVTGLRLWRNGYNPINDRES